MYIFLYQTILIFPIYILFTKIIETFWSRNVTDIWALAHFQSKIHKMFYTISSLYVLNCFKYFLIYTLTHFVPKKWDKENFELYQVFRCKFLCQNDKIFIKIFGLYQVFVWQYISILLMDIKSITCKKNLCFFFLIFWHAKIHHFLKCHNIGIYSSLTFFNCFVFPKVTSYL